MHKRTHCYVIRAFRPWFWLLLTKTKQDDLHHNVTVTYLIVCWTETQLRVGECYKFSGLILILLTWRIWWAPNNVFKWQMGFNSALKGLTRGPTCSEEDFASLTMDENFVFRFINHRSAHSCILRDPYLHTQSCRRISSTENTI